MSREANYHEFKTLPAWTRAVWKGNKVVNESDPYKWGGDFDPPAIGERILVRMNNIGFGKVTTYFAEFGWLGVRVMPEDPPEWYINQNGRDCACHCFGIEIKRS